MRAHVAMLFLSMFLLVGNNLNAQNEQGNNAAEITQLEEGLNFDGTNHQLVYVKNGVSKSMPLWLSILPPFLAILLALIFKEVHVALFTGIFAGVFIINGASFSSLFESLFQIADTYLIQAISPADGGTGHISIIVFSMLIGGMVLVISNNGGMSGIVAKVSTIATSGRRAQFATWLMGMLIFFDDYANTLVVGNTMRPLTDKYRISREKLAYLVDSTAAPIAAIGLVTTWIGFQLAEIDKGMAIQNFVETDISAYSLFLGSLQYSLYPVLTIFFVLLMIITKREFGPMLKAEKNALASHSKENDSSSETEKTTEKNRWYNGAIPIIVLVAMVILGIVLTGNDPTELAKRNGFFNKMQFIVGNGDSYTALLWASLAGSLAAIILSIFTKTLSLKDSIFTYIEGLKSMLPAVVILVLAWALALVIEQIYTAEFLIALVPQSSGSAAWLPFIIFIISAAVSFSTGSSWSTMAIMYPICIPLVLGVATMNGTSLELASYMPVLLNTVSVILAASVFGDHCSPISDTTILSSLASDCDHMSHVKTQMPYALIVGGISLFCGTVLFAFGSPWYLNYLIGFGLLLIVVRFLGKTVTE